MSRKIVSSLMLLLLAASMFTVAFNIQPVRASGSIYIRADGSIDPSTAPIYTADNITYTLTGNVTSDADGIVVERDNIVVDGLGFTVEGAGATLYPYYSGMYLDGRSNVTIRNTNIKNLHYAIWLGSSSNNSISGNNITNNYYGVRLDYSSSNSIAENNIMGSDYCGVWISISDDNSISGNNVTNNYYGIFLESCSNNSIVRNNITANDPTGIMLNAGARNNSICGNMFTDDGLVTYCYPNSVADNTVNGRPLVYLEGVANCSVGDAGQVILVRCDSIKVENHNLSRTSIGVQLLETNNSSISRNSIIANKNSGIHLLSSSSNIIEGNDLGNTSSFRTSPGGRWGVVLEMFSNYNTITKNNIMNSQFGVHLENYVEHNFVAENTITDCVYGITVLSSSNHNSIYHNNLINNTNQALALANDEPNNWDNGYPSGGNYWSDHAGVDLFSGPYQNETGSDNIGDSPYRIARDANNQDNYPLMDPWSKVTVLGANVTKGHTLYPVEIVSNATISGFKETPGSMKLAVSGETGTTGYVRIVQPTDLNSTNIKVFLNNTRLVFPSTDPPRSISTNGTHYFIYFTVTFNSTFSVSVQYPITGDITGNETGIPDGIVDIRDVSLVAKNFGKLVPPAPANCDLTGPTAGVPDGKIDIRDVSLVARHFGDHYP